MKSVHPAWDKVEADGRFVHVPFSGLVAPEPEAADLTGGESRNHFLHDFYDLAEIPHTTPHARAGIAWWQTEGGATAGVCWSNWNPWNTTQWWPGSWTINSVGVRAYATRADGLAATLKTITQTRYTSIMRLLHDPDSHAVDICRAINSSEWGTGGAGDLIFRVLNDIRMLGLYDSYAQIRVYPS